MTAEYYTYDGTFKNPPESLICSICCERFADLLLSCCGNHICKVTVYHTLAWSYYNMQGCIEHIKTDRKPCPFCKKTTYDESKLDISGKISKQRIYCNQDGCFWEGKYAQLNTHLLICHHVNKVHPNGWGQSYPVTCYQYIIKHAGVTCRKYWFITVLFLIGLVFGWSLHSDDHLPPQLDNSILQQLNISLLPRLKNNLLQHFKDDLLLHLEDSLADLLQKLTKNHSARLKNILLQQVKADFLPELKSSLLQQLNQYSLLKEQDIMKFQQQLLQQFVGKLL